MLRELQKHNDRQDPLAAGGQREEATNNIARPAILLITASTGG
jgi:hypothetical protein